MYLGHTGEKQRRRIFIQRRMLDEEHERSESLLRNMLPAPIAERLKRQTSAIADGFESVTVLFADIAGFTPMSERMAPADVVKLLNDVFSTFDEMAQRHGLEKIKTIGDAYMVVGGVPTQRSDHAVAVAEMALEMRAALSRFGDGKLSLRIGIHSGPVVAGIIGTAKYSYDLWGDTVNTASRMESHGAPGEIHVSGAARDALGESFELAERGVVEIKGKGPMRTWWLRGRREATV
jgi:class 3 adenylate cyclase